ncbi:MAG TPA: hypothetical protein VFN99_03510 [Gaiella sp.]|nr:hypothetical protein [Gaiella sp.]
MIALRLVVLAASLAACLCAVPDEAAAAPGPPTASCNGGGCGGWFRGNVTVTWSYDPAGVTSTSGCGAASVTEDTGGATFTCTVNYGGPFYGNSVTVRKDSTPPSVGSTISRDPDGNGWYTKPVAFSFSGDGGPSGIASCTSGTYGGPDGGAVTISGTCTDGAGNSAGSSFTIKYDATPPEVTAAPERAADAAGWYNHPVKVTFTGKDGGSGIAQCTDPVTYAGPDANPAKIVGQCRDHAGHLSSVATLELRYDATKPAPPNVTLSHRGTAIALSWTRTGEVVRSQVVRAPGPKGKKPAVVFEGQKNTLVDRKIRSGTRYWYEVRVYDQAGNVAAKAVNVRPAVGVFFPTPGAVLKKPPVVTWSPVKRARFYNVQLWRGDAKLLTTWPRAAKFRIRPTWMFSGKRQRLANGKYRLFVWPAFGTPRKPDYGKLVGQVSFVVRR